RTLTGITGATPGDAAGWSRPDGEAAAPSGVDPLALAAALVKLLRAPLPAPEELSAVAERGRRASGTEGSRFGGPREAGSPPPPSEGVWFRVSVGRDGQADPRWILPLLCKRGDVSRAEIGRIRIQDQETQVEIAPYAAGHFASHVRRPGGEDAHIRVEPMQPLPRTPRAPHAPRSPQAPRSSRAPRRKHDG
ncbi:MAG TPA: DbpA RNA binding domain-containing protein, partial [Roseomonas sp.]